MKRFTATRQISGFTIVELLIVIVVIGILAAITIVAYNGVQERARTAELKSSLLGAAKQLEIAKVGDGTYPTSIASIKKANDIDYQYTYNADTDNYCLTGTKGTLSYKIQSGSATTSEGGCAGHSASGVAAITNLARNTSSETTNLNLNNGGGASASRSPVAPYVGTYSSLLTKGTGYGFLSLGSGASFGTGGEQVTVSAWVKSSTSDVRFVQRGGGVPYGSIAKAVTPNTWTRISHTYTITSGATSFYVDVGWESSQAPSGATLYVDGVMATAGSTLYGFADGSTPNWVWNGTPENATSTGVPI